MIRELRVDLAAGRRVRDELESEIDVMEAKLDAREEDAGEAIKEAYGMVARNLHAVLPAGESCDEPLAIYTLRRGMEDLGLLLLKRGWPYSAKS